MPLKRRRAVVELERRRVQAVLNGHFQLHHVVGDGGLPAAARSGCCLIMGCYNISL